MLIYFNVILSSGNKKLACSGLGPSGMEEDCIGGQGPQWTVVPEKKKKNPFIYT
jgi:hypothetical protein